MVIFVVEHQDFITGRIIQHGCALSLAQAEEGCEALWRSCGGNRLDFWVQSYIVRDGEYITFD